MPSISQILRENRNRYGISLEEVAQRTYIKLPYLIALEEGRLDKLPAPVYIHGYIRQYAKLLGLDGNDLVRLYQEEIDGGEAARPIPVHSFDPTFEETLRSTQNPPHGQAQQVIMAAQKEAKEMRISAERYADQVLGQLENDVSRALQIVRNGRLYIQSKRRKAE
jgi:cytoskeletal protein RodZ